MKKYLELIRAKHWIKNILIFIPLLCSSEFNKNDIIKIIFAFIAFSFATSFIYIINDIRDIEKDKLHPRKCQRPLPSGIIKKNIAIYIAIIMIALSIIINCLINKSIINIPLYLLLTYVIINLLYSWNLKNIAIVDVVILASGFVIRVYYGASINNIEVSSWLFLTILNASLFLGLGKRKKELEKNKESRKVLEEYNKDFLDKFQYIELALTLVFYSLWAMEQNIKYLAFTIPLVIIIFMRYCLIIEKSDEGDPTTILYQDRMLIILSVLYMILMFLILIVI